MKLFRALSVPLSMLILAGAMMYSKADTATAGHTPANKVVASGRTAEEFGAGVATEIMSATLRTSNPTDLIMSVTLECAILTKLLTAGGPEETYSAATVNAQIDVWIEENGKVVPISSISSTPQKPGAGGTVAQDSVTFCQRDEGRGVTDAEDDTDGIDRTQTYQNTKSANAFNWVLLNAGSGVHNFKVMATLVDTDATNEACTIGLTVEETCSQAWIGNRTFVIEPAKLANDATIN